MSETYLCPSCGQMHADLPLDIAFDKPGAYFLLSPRDRKEKCKVTSDWCIIDNKHFLIRGCLYIPVQGIKEHFVWGLWAEVSEHAFERYQTLYEMDGTKEMPCRGMLSVEREARYSGMNGLLVNIQFSTADGRPYFHLLPSNHVLCRDQQNGITLHRVHEILHRVFPNQY